VNEDPTELRDLAASNPAKLKEMKALFESEAEANHVYPLLNWSDLYPRFQTLWKTGFTGGSASGE
jgi:arylsulfatase